MDRLKLLDAGLRAFDARLPDVVPPLCLVTRYRASSCRRCRAVCTTDAISPSPWLRVDPDRCTSCGACGAVCPTGALAFAALGGQLRLRLAEARCPGRGQATLACRFTAQAAAQPDPAYGDAGAVDRDGVTVAVPCLGALSAADLIGAAAAGYTVLVLASAECEACADRAAGAAAQTAVDTAVETLAALGRGLSVRRRRAPGGPPREAPAAPGISRRDLFAFVVRGARRTASEGLASERRGVADLHGQAPPPASRTRLLDDLGALGSTAGLRTVRLPAALPLATLVASPGCTGCGLCARYCPHGALGLTDGALVCDTTLCTGCGLCAEACPPAALELAPATLSCAAVARDAQPALVRLWPKSLSVPGPDCDPHH